MSHSQATFFLLSGLSRWVWYNDNRNSVQTFTCLWWVLIGEALNFLALLTSGAHPVFNNNLATWKILFLRNNLYFKSNSTSQQRARYLCYSFQATKNQHYWKQHAYHLLIGLRSLGLHQNQCSLKTGENLNRISIVIVPDPFFPSAHSKEKNSLAKSPREHKELWSKLETLWDRKQLDPTYTLRISLLSTPWPWLRR